MQADHGASIQLNIPFYRQHYDFTCGPASLMMAMKYLDNDVCLGKELELDLWREGTLVDYLWNKQVRSGFFCTRSWIFCKSYQQYRWN